jgi:mannose/fructose/N-acetylgalactosamine-specific phosphotransferase system component IIC
MVLSWLGFSLLSTLAFLENSLVGPFFLLRPVLLLPLLGFLSGHGAAGLLAGLTGELFFAADPAMGAHLPPNPAPAFTLALAAVILTPIPETEMGTVLLPVILTFGFLWSWSYPLLTRRLRHFQDQRSELFMEAARNGDARGFLRSFRNSFLLTVLAVWGFSLVLLGFNLLLLTPVRKFFVTLSLDWFPIVEGMLLGTVVQLYHHRREKRFLYLGVVLGGLWIWLTVIS